MKERVLEIIAEEFNVEVDDLNKNINFKDDLNADSIELLELVLALEDEFNVEISEDDVMEIATIGDVFEFIEDYEEK
ncbi:MAG: acyl carrier protein [Tissierellia bacterium]|nr:acyl carrier protein [Tissierellia bacterium]